MYILVKLKGRPLIPERDAESCLDGALNYMKSSKKNSIQTRHQAGEFNPLSNVPRIRDRVRTSLTGRPERLELFEPREEMRMA